jgi:dTDP-4-amino-4,6-dideoxygalactose transaminase
VGTIEKRALEPDAFVRHAEPFPSARTAFKAVLSRMGVPGQGAVLLPAYIGWSRREGSGVFDPIRELGAPYDFYRVTRELRIDLADLARTLYQKRPRVLLLIHYFGYPDPLAKEAAALARDAGVLVVEDEAHALYSDLVGGVCGRWGSASILSLHKMLPLDTGGLLLANDSRWYGGPAIESRGPTQAARLLDFDLVKIAMVRRRNARFLCRRLEAFRGHLTPLHRVLPHGVVPQSLPVILEQAPRDSVYAKLNEAGFGAVSLYHTLISEIDTATFPDSYWISRRVLNLPVHQDASQDALEAMVVHLATLLGTSV